MKYSLLICSHLIALDLVSKTLARSLPVCTLSPICSSAIVTDLPFSRETLAVEGKHGSMHSQHRY